MKRIFYNAVVLLVVAGCASTSRPPASTARVPATPPPVAAAPAARPETRPSLPPPAASAAARPSLLAAEQRWLEQLFEGTPVRISAEAGGDALQLLVPMAHSFEADSPKPKPALQAVLDKLGQSLKRQPASKLRIGAPGPAARALAARQHVLSRGVAAHRVEAAAVSSGDGVQLRLSLVGTSGVGASGASGPGRDGDAPLSAARQSH